MMSQYGNMSYYIDNVETTDVSYESALLSMQQDLAEGNYLLYNQYSNETEQSEVLNEYGQRNFDLTSRYLDYGVFDSDGEQLLDNVGETTAQLLMTDDEESAGYEFRVRYTFSSIDLPPGSGSVFRSSRSYRHLPTSSGWAEHRSVRSRGAVIRKRERRL